MAEDVPDRQRRESDVRQAERGGFTWARTRAVAFGVAVATAVAGCGGGGDVAGGGGEVTTSEVVQVAGVSRLAPSAGAPVDEVVSGMNAFAADLVKAAKADKNFVFSPLSVAYAFAMLRVGAKGKSADELDKAFDLPSNFESAFNALTTALVSATSPPAPTPVPTGEVDHDPPPADPIFTIANALFTQRGYDYVPDFLRTVTEQFGGEVRPLDFAGANDDSVAAINRWADEKTRGRIRQVFEHLDPMTRFVLANAVYLKADWKQPFSTYGEQPFTVAGSPVNVPMMHSERSVGYSEGKNWKAIELPYFGDRLAMRILLPTGSATPADLLTPAVLTASAKTTPTEASLTMPKWDFSTDLDLRKLMPALGVEAIFQDGAADLSGITTSERLFIDQALHKANITVDELGTVASAVTAMSGVATSAHLPPPLNLTVDRAFAFAIVDTKTGAPLFVGQVTDPRAH
jgi:serpin B